MCLLLQWLTRLGGLVCWGGGHWLHPPLDGQGVEREFFLCFPAATGKLEQTGAILPTLHGSEGLRRVLVGQRVTLLHMTAPRGAMN